MPADVLHAFVQLPIAALLSIAFFREAFRLNSRGARQRRMHGLLSMGSITAGLLAWRFSTLIAFTPPELRPDGEQVTQTVLLVGLGIAYVLLKEHPRHT